MRGTDEQTFSFEKRRQRACEAERLMAGGDDIQSKGAICEFAENRLL